MFNSTNIRVESLSQPKNNESSETSNVMSTYKFALKNQTMEQMNTLKENVYSDMFSKEKDSESSKGNEENKGGRSSEKYQMRRLSIKKKPRDLSLLMSFKNLFEVNQEKVKPSDHRFKQQTNSTSSRNSSDRKSVKSIVRKMLIEMANSKKNDKLPKNFKTLRDLIKKYRRIPFIGIKETPYYDFILAKNPNQKKDILKESRK